MMFACCGCGDDDDKDVHDGAGDGAGGSGDMSTYGKMYIILPYARETIHANEGTTFALL